MKDAFEIYKSIRKPVPPATRIERPIKGRGYRRPRNKKEIYGQEREFEKIG